MALFRVAIGCLQFVIEVFPDHTYLVFWQLKLNLIVNISGVMSNQKQKLSLQLVHYRMNMAKQP